MLNKLRLWLLVFGLFSVIGTPSFAAGAVPPEEVVVRATYTKLSLAFRNEWAHAHPDSTSFDWESLPQIQIGPVKVGSVRDLADQYLDELVTKPSPEMMLPVSLGGWSFNKGPATLVASAQWQRGPLLTEDWHVPFPILERAMGVRYGRYASFEVRVRFEGRERTYKALFLSEPIDRTNEVGEEPDVLVLDHVMRGVSGIMNGDLYPFPLLAGQNRKLSPVAKEIVRGLTIEECTRVSAVNLCCNENGSACGFRRAELEKRGVELNELLLPTTIFSQETEQTAKLPVNRDRAASDCSSYTFNADEVPYYSYGVEEHLDSNYHSGAVSF